MEGTVKISVEDFKLLIKQQEEVELLKKEIHQIIQDNKIANFEIAQDVTKIIEHLMGAHNGNLTGNLHVSRDDIFHFMKKIVEFKQLKNLVFGVVTVQGQEYMTIIPKAINNTKF